jgi:hypothetical protein
MVWDADATNRRAQCREEYSGFIVSFYRGSLVAGGWLSVQRRLLEPLTWDERRVLEPELTALGMIISAEWAKDNSCRRITSSMLMTWARTLSDARDHASLATAIATVHREALALLRGEATADRKPAANPGFIRP